MMSESAGERPRAPRLNVVGGLFDDAGEHRHRGGWLTGTRQRLGSGTLE
jgi:hypothetical protein